MGVTAMRYKEYIGRATLEGGVYHGRVLNCEPDVVTFESDTTEKLEGAFHQSVDDYLDFCRQRGEPPMRNVTCLDRILNDALASATDEAAIEGLQMCKSLQSLADYDTLLNDRHQHEKELTGETLEQYHAVSTQVKYCRELFALLGPAND